MTLWLRVRLSCCDHSLRSWMSEQSVLQSHSELSQTYLGPVTEVISRILNVCGLLLLSKALLNMKHFKFLAPLEGKTVLQLGGKGTEAVRMVLAGAKCAHLVSPVKSELECGQELARLCGVAIESREGLAERIPYSDETFDVVYSSGSAHHFKTHEAFPEIRRVLKSNGRFAAIEPWRAPFYKLGIRVFGKREKDVHCRPLDWQRVSTFQAVFRVAEVRQSGTLSRYPMIAAYQMGLPISVGAAWHLMKADDFICAVFRLRSWGSCAAILAER